MMETYPSQATLADAAAAGVAAALREALRLRGRAGLEAAGATTALLRGTPEGLGNPPLARVTLTLAALAQSRALFLLIAGEAKRQVLARAEAGEDLPVGRLIRRAAGSVRVLWAPSH